MSVQEFSRAQIHYFPSTRTEIKYHNILTLLFLTFHFPSTVWVICANSH